MRDQRLALTIGGVGEARVNIGGCQVWEVGENFFFRHPDREVRENVVDGDPHPTDRRPSTAFPRFDGDDPVL